MTDRSARGLTLASVLLSLLTGVSVGWAGWITHQEPGSVGTTVPLLSAGLSGCVFAWGWMRSWKLLDVYAREEQALPQCAPALAKAAEFEQELLKARPATEALAGGAPPAVEPAQTESVPAVTARLLSDLPVPLLHSRLDEAMRALRLGAPLTADSAASSVDRRFAGPAREIRACMDGVLGIGAAGTLLSLIPGFSAAGHTPEVLILLGPALISGLAGVLANVALRMCHAAVAGREEQLALAVDRCLADNFLSALPKAITSPEERLALTVQRLLNNQVRLIHNWMKEALEPSLVKLAKQSEALTAHVGEIAGHSKAWGDVNRDLQLAHVALLRTQKESQQSHDERAAGLAAVFQKSIQEFGAGEDKDRTLKAQQTQQFYIELQSRQTEFLKGLLTHLNERFVSLLETQAESERLQSDKSIAKLGELLGERTSAIESQVENALNALSASLPETLRVSLQSALSGAVDLVDLVREQAGAIAQAVNQVSQNADRQLRSYEQWAERAGALQQQEERNAAASQAAQERLAALWQQQAADILGRIGSAYEETARVNRAAYDTLATALANLGALLKQLEEPTRALTAQLREVSSPVRELQSTLAAISGPLSAVTANLDRAASATTQAASP